MRGLFLSHYLRHHPGVEVHLTENGGAPQHSQLERGEIHLALMASDAERFRARLPYPIHLMVFVPTKHRLGRHAILNIAELADEPLLLDREFCSGRGWTPSAIWQTFFD